MASGDGGDFSVPAGALRIFRHIGAALGGVLTAVVSLLGLVSYNPDIIIDRDAVRELVLADSRMVQRHVRPDPWTGTQGRAQGVRIDGLGVNVDDLRDQIGQVHNKVIGHGSRLRKIEQANVLFSDHVVKSEKGWDLIYDNAAGIRENSAKLDIMIEEIRRLQDPDSHSH